VRHSLRRCSRAIRPCAFFKVVQWRMPSSANAKELAAVGGAIVIDDAALTPEILQREVAQMSVASVRQRVGAAAASLARPGSAEEIAEILLRLGRRG
jgi:UDP-N-acetylglucosamine:LPS N-acetylglucosamine transferase